MDVISKLTKDNSKLLKKAIWLCIYLLVFYDISLAISTSKDEIKYGVASLVLVLITANFRFFKYFLFKSFKSKRYFLFPIIFFLIYVNSTFFLFLFFKYFYLNDNPGTYIYEMGKEISTYKNFLSVLFTGKVFKLFAAFFLGYFSIAAAFLSLVEIKKYLDRINTLQQENTELELSFLKSQINPHFLFNTLNSIYSLTIDNEKASSTILKLSDLMRYTLYETSQPKVSLNKEIKFLTEYIELEKLRHMANVKIDLEVVGDINDQVKVTPLLLVNFVENAFKHGINKARDNKYAFFRIELTPSNKLLFFSENRIHKNVKKVKAEGGIGLDNVNKRLEAYYKNKYTLEMKKVNNMYQVNLELDLRR